MTTSGNMRALLLAGTALSAAAFAPAEAYAQPVPEPAEASSNTSSLEEIVVTAQKREQSLQDVPIAVTAISSNQLVANRITNVQDLSGLAPNTIVRPAAGGTGIATFTMRGVTSYGVVPGSDKEVSIYLDGVYISSTRASIFDVPDIARIEVLRGPQGTLFGRNATAGAVSIVTRDPKGQFQVTQQVTIGNYNQFRSRTSVDLPSWGPFSAYVSYLHGERDGDVKNLGAGTVWDRTSPGNNLQQSVSPKTLGAHDSNSVFAAVMFEPSDSFKTVYKFDRTVDHFTPEANAVIGINPASPLLGPLFAALVAGSPNQTFAPDGKRPKYVNNSFTVPGIQRNMGHNLTSDFRASDHLSFKNIAAYRKAYLYGVSEIGGLGGLILSPSAVPAYTAFLTGSGVAPATAAATAAALVNTRFIDVATQRIARSQQWSDELQANYDSELLTLTVGGIYFHSKDREGGPEFERGTYNLVAGIPNATGLLPLGAEAVSYNKATSVAGYGQAEVHVLPVLDVVGGFRYTQDKKSGSYVTGGTFIPTSPGARTGVLGPQTIAPFTYKKSQPSYLAGVNYKPTKNILLYGKYSTAYVSGGKIADLPWEPETAKSWEAGIKATVLDGRLRSNLALFSTKYKHQQSAQSGRLTGRPTIGTVIVDTQAASRAKGFEFEGTALPFDGLTLGGTVGYTHIKYLGPVNSLLGASVGLPAGSPDYQVTLNPKWTTNLSAQYETEPLFADSRLSFRIDANWRSKFRFDANPDIPLPVFAPVEYSPASWVVNGRVSLSDIKFGIADGTIALWGRNINNNKSAQFLTPVRPTFIGVSYQTARTFGVDLTLHLKP